MYRYRVPEVHVAKGGIGLHTAHLMDRISRELDTKLANYLRISSVSLEAPLWNFDHGVVEGYLDTLMLDETVVYANVSSPDGTVTNRARPQLVGLGFVDIAASQEFKARDSGVMKDGEEIGRIELVLSRAAVRHGIITNIAAIFAVTLLVLVTITVASIIISRRSVARPLANLRNSTSAIESGNLQTGIDTQGQNENDFQDTPLLNCRPLVPVQFEKATIRRLLMVRLPQNAATG